MTTRNGVRFVIPVALTASLLAAGCDMGLQEQLDEKKKARYAAASQAVTAFETDRTGKLAASLPAADAEWKGNQHPLLAWRTQTASRADGEQLLELSTITKPEVGSKYKVGLMGTPSQRGAELASTFANASSEYWGGKSSTGVYLQAIDNFLADSAKARAEADEAKVPFVDPPFRDEALFDKTFVHVVRYLQLQKLAPGASVSPQIQDYWELAFDIESKRGSFSDFVSRICFVHPQLKERCKGVPHELRPHVVNQPYLQLLKDGVDRYKASESNKVFTDVMGRFGAALDQALKAQPAIVEDPVLPSTFSPIGGVSGLRFLFSKQRGVMIHDKQVAETFTGKVPKDFASQTAAKVEEVKSTPGNRINYEIAVIEAPGDLAGPALVKIMRGLPLENVKKALLVGRRRADETMRLAPTRMLLPLPDTSKTTAFKFQEDRSPTTCNLMGYLGEANLGEPDRFFLQITPTRMRIAAATLDKETKQWDVKTTSELGSPSDLAKLEEFLEKNEGELRLFISDDFNYNDILKHVTRLLYKCVDEEVPGTDTTKPPVMRQCGAPEARDFRVRLAICD